MCIHDCPPSYCNEACGHLRDPRSLEDIFNSLQPLPPLPQVLLHDISHPAALQGFVTVNADMLAQIETQVHSIRCNLNALSTSMTQVQVPPLYEIEEMQGREEKKSEKLDSAALLLELAPGQTFQYALKLYSDFRSPLYKNRPFK